jgi:hypothetical protein
MDTVQVRDSAGQVATTSVTVLPRVDAGASDAGEDDAGAPDGGTADADDDGDARTDAGALQPHLSLQIGCSASGAILPVLSAGMLAVLLLRPRRRSPAGSRTAQES